MRKAGGLGKRVKRELLVLTQAICELWIIPVDCLSSAICKELASMSIQELGADDPNPATYVRDNDPVNRVSDEDWAEIERVLNEPVCPIKESRVFDASLPSWESGEDTQDSQIIDSSEFNIG